MSAYRAGWLGLASSPQHAGLLNNYLGQAPGGVEEQPAAARCGTPRLCVASIRSCCGPSADWHADSSFSAALHVDAVEGQRVNRTSAFVPGQPGRGAAMPWNDARRCLCGRAESADAACCHRRGRRDIVGSTLSVQGRAGYPHVVDPRELRGAVEHIMQGRC